MSSRGKSSIFQIILVGCGVVLLTLLAGCTSAVNTHNGQSLLTPAAMPALAVDLQYPREVPDIAKGAITYVSKCQACHGVSGSGNGSRAEQVKTQGGLVANLVDKTTLSTVTPAEWFDTVKNGRLDRLMPGFSQSLSDQDIWNVLGYVWAMGTTSPNIETGRDLYVVQCVTCHGADGRGGSQQTSGAAVTNLASLNYMAKYSLQDVSQAMISGTVHQQMKLDEAQRMEVADYIRGFSIPYTDTTNLAKNAFTGDGVLRVGAVNGTPDSGSTMSMPVILRIYDSNGEVLSRTAMLDAHRVATFQDLPRDMNLFLQAETIYEGAKFYAAPAQFTSTQQLSVTLPVYEVTRDPSVISISGYHYFVQDVGEGAIAVIEYYIFDNSSDKAYISDPGPDGQMRSVKVLVPKDATNLHFDGPGIGTRFSLDDSILYDGDAVPPGHGASTIVMLYNVPYQAGRKIEQLVYYPVKSWNVILPDNVMRIPDMTDKGLQSVSTTSVRLYAPLNAEVPAGGAMAFTLTGQPRTLVVQGSDGRAVVVGLISVVLAASLVSLLYIQMRRKATADVDIENVKDDLLKQIADLDARYAVGSIKESEYHVQREEIKQDLRDIW